jgi:hypothetical protein
VKVTVGTTFWTATVTDAEPRTLEPSRAVADMMCEPLMTVVEFHGPVVDTVAVAVSLFRLPALFVILTQKFVVVVSAGIVKVLEFVPTGVVVVPLEP